MPETNKRERIVLIDGHGLAYRMFFAPHIPDFRTANDEPTKATYGFTQTLLTLIKSDNPPDYLAVSFDVGDTFRNEMFADYKGTREKVPEDLEVQVERLHNVLEAFNIPVLEIDGYEADDVLGTLARQAEEQGLEVLIVTGDRDLLQLVTEHTKLQMPPSRRGGSNKDEIYDIAAVEERFGVRPDQFVDYKALIGDKSDNIPGVPGIGEKTAAQLLQQYGTLDGIYENLSEITGKKARTALEENREAAYFSRKLSAIVRDVPLSFELEKCRTHDYDRDKVAAIFKELEFRRFLEQILGKSDSPAKPSSGQMSMFESPAAPPSVMSETETPPTRTIIVQDEAALAEMIARLESAAAIAFDTETTSTDQMLGTLVGISLAVESGEGYYIPIGHTGEEAQLPRDVVLDRLRPVMTDPDIPKGAHNAKYDAIVLARHGLEVSPISFDTMIGQFLIDPDKRIGLKDLAWRNLGIEMTEIKSLIGTGKNQITMDQVSIEQAAPYAAADADMTLRLMDLTAQQLAQNNMEPLFNDLEMPLVPVLVDVEMAGVLVDTDLLHQLSAELGETLASLENQICEICGYKFNLNSTQQLSKALFEVLQIPTQGLRKTASGHYSTAADVLEGLMEQDKTGVITMIMQYRELEKLRSTYLDALPTMVHPETGRIHTSYNQTGAVTGRISSSNPNLQNIPIRTDIGRRVRDAFIAAPGHKLVAADYSQVELRILAHVAGDEHLIQAFREGQDIHASTAATVSGIPIEQVTRQQRSFAKSVNFGLMYGMSSFRLARDAKIPLAEAESFINAYFERFSGVRKYLDDALNTAKEQGYLETLLGRRRYFPTLQSQSASRQDVARAEREAINMPIQGTAADIIKIAMVRLHNTLREHGLRSRMILQVHDELVLEAPDEEVEEVSVLVRKVMENAYTMNIPLQVDVNVGAHWGDMK
jgi:DNA polymerase I